MSQLLLNLAISSSVFYFFQFSHKYCLGDQGFFWRMFNLFSSSATVLHFCMLFISLFFLIYLVLNKIKFFQNDW